MSHDNGHPSHPVRNFFYTLYSLFNILAFLAFFYALYAVSLPSRTLLLIGTGAVIALGLFFGVIRPIFRAKR